MNDNLFDTCLAVPAELVAARPDIGVWDISLRMTNGSAAGRMECCLAFVCVVPRANVFECSKALL